MALLRLFRFLFRRSVSRPDLETASLDPGRRIFLQRGPALLSGVLLGGTAYNVYRREYFEVSEITVPLAGLPPAFQGFTVGLLSDIHSSAFMTKSRMAEYARVLNSLQCDVVAMPGDFVNSTLEEAFPLAEAFSGLRAASGVLGTLGNHDFYTREADGVTSILEEAGIRILRNARHTITRGDQSLHFLGVDDTSLAMRAGQLFDDILAGLPFGAPTVLLCHRPYYFQQAAERRIGLVLSGHTHGGQVVFLRLGRDVFAPARIASPYVAGAYTLANSRMYVSRGIGTVGVPFRLNCPPEITRIKLVQPSLLG